MVDPLTLFSLLGAIVGGTVFLNNLIAENIMGKRRRKRSSTSRFQNGTADESWSDPSSFGELMEDIFVGGKRTTFLFQNSGNTYGTSVLPIFLPAATNYSVSRE